MLYRFAANEEQADAPGAGGSNITIIRLLTA